MRTLVLALVIAVIPTGQSGSAAVEGSWTAEFNGRTYIRLELRAVRDTIAGRLSIGDIEVDGQGHVRHVTEPSQDPTPIFDVTQQGSIVTFSRKDGNDTDRFEFRVQGRGRGELRFLLTEDLRKQLAADGIPVPKPIILTRQTQANH
jgi:hypothetical protein